MSICAACDEKTLVTIDGQQLPYERTQLVEKSQRQKEKKTIISPKRFVILRSVRDDVVNAYDRVTAFFAAHLQTKMCSGSSAEVLLDR